MPVKTLIAIYDGELRHDRWHPPLAEALRVLPLAERQHCERIRIERLGGIFIEEFSVPALRLFATRRGYSITPQRTTVEAVDWESHRPMWAVGDSDSRTGRPVPPEENPDGSG